VAHGVFSMLIDGHSVCMEKHGGARPLESVGFQCRVLGGSPTGRFARMAGGAGAMGGGCRRRLAGASYGWRTGGLVVAGIVPVDGFWLHRPESRIPFVGCAGRPSC